ncbi:MAG TPA: hypothetical protein VF620_13035 [Allosphingosinicella sp.]|jgi:hypothetical protein
MAKRDEERAKRLAEALRENLRRRKAQARGEEDIRIPGESRDLGPESHGGSHRGPGFRQDDG